MAQIYVSIQGQPTGPLTEDEVRVRAARGEFQPTDLYWCEGMSGWLPLGQWSGWNLSPSLHPSLVPPPLPPYLEPTPQVVYGGFWIRVGATLLDGLVLGLFVGTPMNILMPLFMPPPPQNPQGTEEVWAYLFSVIPILLAMMVLNFLAQWLYFAYMESSSRQATLGKMACGLMVTDTKGNRISFGRATARFFAKNLVSNLLTLGIGFMMCGWTERRQCLHDMMVSTVVIRRKQKS